VLGLCGGAVEVSCAGDWVSSSGGMVLEVLGDWSTGVAAAETVADAGVSVSGASHGVVGWSGGWSAEHDQHQPPCMTRDIADFFLLGSRNALLPDRPSQRYTSPLYGVI
jgi:hypothetical protein